MILEMCLLLVSMWKRLLNPPIQVDLVSTWSILALTSLLPLWPSLLRVSVYCIWPIMEPLNWYFKHRLATNIKRIFLS